MRKGGRERWERTSLDSGVDKSPVLLPLHTHATGVLPVSWVGLVYFVQRAEAEAVGSIGNVFAEGPPDTLLTCDPALASAIRPLCVNVYWIYARPSVRVMRLSKCEGEHIYFLYGVMSVIVFDGGLADGPREGCGRNWGWEGDAGPAADSSRSSELSSSSDTPISSSSAPRVSVSKGRDGSGRSVSSSNSSTTAVRRTMVDVEVEV